MYVFHVFYSTHICVYVYVYICVFTYSMRVCICVYPHVFVYIYTCILLYIFAHIAELTFSGPSPHASTKVLRELPAALGA